MYSAIFDFELWCFVLNIRDKRTALFDFDFNYMLLYYFWIKEIREHNLEHSFIYFAIWMMDIQIVKKTFNDNMQNYIVSQFLCFIL